MMLATGSRDRSIIVWSTNATRPLFVMNNAGSGAILDISLSSGPDGTVDLLAGASDGSLVYIRLDDSVLTQLGTGTRVATSPLVHRSGADARPAEDDRVQTETQTSTGRRRITAVHTKFEDI